MIRAAMALASVGKPVIPLHFSVDGVCSCRKQGECSNKGKHPRTKNGLKDATTDKRDIEQWHSTYTAWNLGMLTGEPSGVIVVDLDGPEASAWYEQTVPREERAMLIQRTRPDRFHAFYAMPEGVDIRNSADKIGPHVDIRANGGYIIMAPSVHYTGTTYQMFLRMGRDYEKVSTADPEIWDALVPLPPPLLNACLENSRLKPTARPKGQAETTLPRASEGGRNDVLARLAGRWFKAGKSKDDVLLMAYGWNQTHCTPPLDDSEVMAVVCSIAETDCRNNPTKVTEDTALKVISSWVANRNGEWNIRDLDHDLCLNSAEGRAMRDRSLQILQETNVIELTGQSANKFRRVCHELDRINIGDSVSTELDIELPLAMNLYTKIMPSNLIVIAGESNAGKTALALRLAWMNRHRWRIRYLSSEMFGDELTDRCTAIGSRHEWGNVDFFARGKDFADAIDPNGINIIDYLEVPGSEFFRIAEYLRDIFDKLDQGVAFVVIQKKKGSLYGRGGEFTIEKARLAISLSSVANTPDSKVVMAKVTKCKNFKDGRNLDGRTCFFEVVRGCDLDTGRLRDAGIREAGLWFWPTDKELEDAIKRLETYARKRQDGEVQE